MDELVKTIAIEAGKAIIKLGVEKLQEWMSADEVHETVASILPELSESRKAQHELEGR